MEIYTLPLARTDHLQAFEGSVALVYKQTQSSEPLALLRSLPMEILGQNYGAALEIDSVQSV